MTDIESLCRLTEAVEAAGADIAPTYLEYVQLSFAIATDCGEAGREFFHRLCRVSPKYQREHAERVFSNALHTQRGEVHLGTAFHLAEATGVAISYVETVGTVRTAPQILTQARAYNKVANEETDEETITEEKKNYYPVAIRNTRSPLCRKQTGRNSCSVSSKLRKMRFNATSC